ncbi:hypothetical protein L211DRAFT_880709 [Terfezia boudieri ATCC MYA-4762]|uniref:Uncharacterized protein n=1 Tax=Terfezia boudieri ATCC MYA-4762 TaxID=1051890 RepID=A0A3N4LL78_9PEZI|nr:hypothetical protein L211DRAFT_880709 [Terfezia boudieri ATCC MYA-4762]
MHDTSDTDSDTDTEDPVTPVNPVTDAALLFARQIVIHTTGDGSAPPPPSAKKAIWCLREVLTYIKGDVERIFADKVFGQQSRIFTDLLSHGGAAWVNSTSPTPPTTTESSTQTTPPPQPPPVTHKSSQTTPPTPKLKPPTNSVSVPGPHRELNIRERPGPLARGLARGGPGPGPTARQQLFSLWARAPREHTGAHNYLSK